MTPKPAAEHSIAGAPLRNTPGRQMPPSEHPVPKRPAPERPHLTVTPEEIAAGKLCRCEACLRDGPHEPACAVHDEPKGRCSCGREDQSKGAG